LLNVLKIAIGIDDILFERGAKIKVIPSEVSAIIRQDTCEEPGGAAHPRFFASSGVFAGSFFFISVAG
jgi:hypothetical protein